MAGDSERALATLADATAINPTARRPHFRRMVVLDQVGRYDEALAERITWLHLLGEGAFAGQLTRLVRTKGYLTAMGDWIALLERLNQWYEVAIQRMVVDDRPGALEALNRCAADKADGIITAARFPSFRPLLGDARFQRILRDIGLVTMGLPQLRELNGGGVVHYERQAHGVS